MGDRIPPHDLIAEALLLGAMLLSTDALAAGAETCSAADFYKPAHARVFEAIVALDQRGEPADPTTVADELRRRGKLETIGGPPRWSACRPTPPPRPTPSATGASCATTP